MIEFSWMELGLFVWAVLATALAFEFKHRLTMTGMFVTKLLDDSSFYAEFHTKFKAEQGKRRGLA